MQTKKITDTIVVLSLLFLAIWLSPFIIIGVFFYVIYRIKKIILKKQIIAQVKKEWFPNGKNVFFLYSNSEKWKEYFETELIPKINAKAHIWNWSTRQKDGWNENSLDAKILSEFRPRGCFFPIAIVFLPTGEVKVFAFYNDYIQKIKGNVGAYKKLENEFLSAVTKI